MSLCLCDKLHNEMANFLQRIENQPIYLLLEFSKPKLTSLGSQSVALGVSRGAFDLSGTLLVSVAMVDADNGKECEPLFVAVLSSYVHDHATSPSISGNADFSATLKCLASGKKSME